MKKSARQEQPRKSPIRNQPDVEAYNAWVKQLHLARISLQGAHIEADDLGTFQAKWESLTPEVSERLRHGISEDGKTLGFRHESTLEANLDKLSLKVVATFELIFKSQLPIPQEFIDIFATHSIEFIVRPYIREYYTSTMGRMGLAIDPMGLVVNRRSDDDSVNQLTETKPKTVRKRKTEGKKKTKAKTKKISPRP